ncbi:MAG: hypothetical protein IIX42_04580 [Alistipes sp.]|nr:hypothetical protein [Alistipes sp.]
MIYEQKTLPITKLVSNSGQIAGVPKNPRTIKDARFNALKKSIEDAPEMLQLRELIVVPFGDKFVTICGNMRLSAARDLGMKSMPCKILAEDTPAEKMREYAMKDNIAFGQDDIDLILAEWDSEELAEWGFELPEEEVQSSKGGSPYDTPKEEWESQVEKFIVPPFSVLDSRQGYWVERKHLWQNILGDDALGQSRENTLAAADSLVNNCTKGVSLFDPVLAEILCKWYSRAGDKIIDPFAGDTRKGEIFARCGRKFFGIELRQEQVDQNNKALKGKNLPVEYACDSGVNIAQYVQAKEANMLFSCPPYFDLEVYSDDERDASNAESYEDFLAIIEQAFTAAIKQLQPNSFGVVVIGDVRDKKGYYQPIAADIIRIFNKVGMGLYNEHIYVEQLGTAPLRVNNAFKNRKCVKTHQNVLVFHNGGGKIADKFPDINIETSIYNG